ncbi:hypothetical protein J3R30DRAFT_3288193 [Lentinula aciculospora]|uniref:GPI ethanolamine phosphate transferase 3 n=1 Tax=Lentinula aciculospora TaxID=153920 RepID=A0A9W9DPX6_9AGAR|nr:hypothetical protein J3R30DRAFT_3288193 [Lentinula aciculospora]
MPASSRFFSPSLLLLLWISFVHLAGIYLFTSGFLLTRLALTNVTSCTDGSCTLPATHKRAIVLIIDSLRFDFIAPAPYIPSPNSTDYSTHHHSTLTLPSLLTNSHPRNSFIFNSYPDPPTTTLQRIKGITTGSLPTFVDLGSNFGGSEIEEDSIIGQVGMKGGEVAFMGDDTWMTVFPNAFDANMTWPYDSFNVEDLHTVDNGVITHLFPLLESDKTPDLIIGHFLGVDHVGHRVGPFHPSMQSKLLQMNATLSRVVDLLSNDTLLVVLGDHGMDRSGDHGGDGELETSAAIWIYSKGVELIDDHIGSIPSDVVPYTTFPNAESPHRHIQQIDLVPTLSLLLGLPIPFNNLGSVIPELFWRDSESSSDTHGAERHWGGARKNAKNEDPLLTRALQLNALQVHEYLNTYRASGSGAELDGAWIDLELAWNIASKKAARVQSSDSKNLADVWKYTRLALSSCRAMWAQFNPFLMILGLISLSTSLLAMYAIFTGVRRMVSSSTAPNPGDLTGDWEDWLSALLWQAVRGSAGGATLGFLASLTPEIQTKGVDSLDCILFMAPFTSCILISVHSVPRNHSVLKALSTISLSDLFIALPFILHVMAFFSNSFTFWEDRIVAFLLPSALIPHILTGLRAPTARLHRRILSFAGFTAVCVRLMAISTVCREEQHPYCHVTFYSSTSSTLQTEYTSAVVPPSASSSFAPMLALFGAPLAALTLPILLRLFLKQSKSDQGLASVWFSWVMTPSLICGTGYWLIEYVETAGVVDEAEWATVLRFCRTFLARFAFGWPIVVGGTLWWKYPLCISVQTSESPERQPRRQLAILGFANAYGAPYLLFWTIPFSIVWASTQLTGQIILGFSAVAVMSYLEVLDGVRDVKAVEDAFASNKLSDLLQSGGEDSGVVAQQHSNSLNFKFSEISPLVLLALHSFFRTGHQSTISSIQWKSAFLLSSTVTYPWSPGTAMLNSFGPLWVIGIGGGLAGVWLITPKFSATHPVHDKKSRKNEQSTSPTVLTNEIRSSILLYCLCLSMYFLAILLTTSFSAAILRRHLMVWKVFAPRWMLGVVGMLVGDVSTLTVYIGMWRVNRMVDRTLGRIMGGGG